jgi:hypothetical protein
MTTPVNGFAVTTSHPPVHVIRAAGVLDMSAAARLLRLLDARRALVDQGRSPTRHVVIDLSASAALRTREEPMTEAAIAEYGSGDVQRAEAASTDDSIGPLAPPQQTMAEPASARGAGPSAGWRAPTSR